MSQPTGSFMPGVGRISGPGLLLRIEGLVLFGGALALYAYLGANWWFFALLLLAPDLAILGYLAGPRLGSMLYNLTHTTVLPYLLGLLSLLSGSLLGLSLALIWLAHIGMDRMVGYGLKYRDGFRHTHLDRV
ncbi:MAG: DUF4260 family protein [Oscillochloridaceae bacterium umkhey_bin13]